MKKLLFFILLFISLPAMSQFSERKIKSMVFKDDIQKVQFCLGKYYQQRQGAFNLGIGAAAIFGITTYYASENKDKPAIDKVTKIGYKHFSNLA
jgi:hypothetical protein